MDNPRTHGKSPFSIAVVHGGPGAPGELEPLARELSRNWGTLEPFQSSSSIEEQILELKALLKEHGNLPITLIGHSWGAWLCFIFSSLHSSFVSKLILVGSGPFEEEYAPRVMKTRLDRLDEKGRLQFHGFGTALSDPSEKNKDEVFSKFGMLMTKIDSYDPLPLEGELECNYEIFKSVWKEAEELRGSGRLLELGKEIRCPVIAIHGDYDPHPFEGVEEPLSRILKDFRLILLKNCGHYPWLEKKAKDRFFEVLEGVIRN